MAQAWTYSNWITLAAGSTARLERLRLHIQEVSDRISQGNFSSEGKAHAYDYLQSYLSDLHKREKEESVASAATTGERATFTRGVPYRSGGLPGSDGR